MMFFASTICLPPVRGDFDLAGPGQPAVALDDVDLVLLHQELDALGVLGDDLVLAVDHQGEIEARVLAVNALFDGVLETLPNVGRVEERLGGDAADVQAGAAQLRVFFNNGCFQAVLARANGRRISTGTAPEDDHVICHGFSFSVAGGSGNSRAGSGFQTDPLPLEKRSGEVILCPVAPK